MPSPKSTSTRRPARTSARRATSTEPAVAAVTSIDSPALEVLQALEIQNALSNLEMRMDSLEIDIARQQGSREDDARRIAGEMAVMKARVEDALVAFAGTAEDLREMVRTAQERVAAGVIAETPDAFKAQLAAGLDGMMAGVGDVMEGFASEMRSRVELLGSQMASVQDAMASVADTVVTLAPLASRMTKLERTVARLTDRD